MLANVFTALLAAYPLFSTAQSTNLAGKVGPLTSIAAKKAVKTCDITAYGGKAGSNISAAITSAFAACKTGGVVVIPSGQYNLATWVSLSGGKAWALQLDGIITRTGTAGGNMIFIQHTTNFEMFSSTGEGAVQGLGYQLHKSGAPRLLRFYQVTHFSAHDFALVDAPAFHFSMDTCDSGEVYNMAIRGGYSGGLDGIDLWSTNMWIHDVMVTNKDECVTVKSPAKNILVENIYCNWSGGCGMGSFGTDTNVSDITYKNVYTVHSNNMLLIKSNGGSGTVSNAVFENFIGHANAYSLDIDQYWSSMDTIAGNGVQLNNIVISNWTGTEANGAQRGPIKIACADGAPCTGVDLEDFNMWTETGSSQWYSCRSAYTSKSRPVPLYCLKGGSTYTSYAATTTTVKTAPAGYMARTMAADLTTHFGTTASIPVPALPTMYFPGMKPYSKVAGT
nr:putative rhamnogalacturonase B [Rachicladosporium sp. CCFEE 5018]